MKQKHQESNNEKEKEKVDEHHKEISYWKICDGGKTEKRRRENIIDFSIFAFYLYLYSFAQNKNNHNFVFLFAISAVQVAIFPKTFLFSFAFLKCNNGGKSH